MRTRTVLLLSVLALLMTGATAAPAAHTRDSTQAAAVEVTMYYDSHLEAMDEWVYFGAETPETGSELWRSDGAIIELVVDLAPGPDSSWPREMEAMDGWIYFSAYTPVTGRQLWRTNGVTTERLAEWEALTDLEAMDGWLYFNASTPETGPELWRTDGSVIELVADIVPGSEGSGPSHFVASDGWVYFKARTPATGPELWRSDGSTTELVADIWPGPEGSDLRTGEAMDGWVFFIATSPTHRWQVWRSNGSTTELAAPDVDVAAHAPLKAMSAWVYFGGDSAALSGLWRTNGTVTEHVSSVQVGAWTLEVLDGTLYFDAYHELFGLELWATNGVDAAWMVDDILPGPDASDPAGLTAMDGWVYFSAEGFDGTRTLWRSNGEVTHKVGAGVLFSGFVDASRQLGPKWTKTLYTPNASGAHSVLLEWEGTANLRIAIREYDTGTWIADNVTTDQPKVIETNLTAGVEYKIAVWAKTGAADFTITTVAPPGRVGEEIFADTVDSGRVVARKWVKTIYTPDASGEHEFVLDWEGDAMLRISVKVYSTGVWIGSNTTTDQPKTVTVDLDAGVEYKIAVWAKAGAADFTVTAYPPPE